MTIRDIIPWRKEESKAMAPRDFFEDTFLGLQREMNSLFDDLVSGFGMELSPRTGFSFTPKVDVTESDHAIKVTAELPGLEEKDINVSLDDHHLVLKGEKSEEKEETQKGVHRLERSYGSFYRRIPIPSEVDVEKIEATFSKGVLKIKLPKTEPETAKTIKVKAK